MCYNIIIKDIKGGIVMQITFYQAGAINETLGSINQEISFKTAYKVSKLLQSIQKEIEDFYKPKFKELIDQYAELDEDGNPIEDEIGIRLKVETQNEFNTKANELNNLEIEVPETKFTLEELENININPRKIMNIQVLIEE